MSNIVKVYGPHTCGNCMGITNYLKKKLGSDNVEKVDIDDSPELVDRFSSGGFMSFPVIKYKDKCYAGNKNSLEEIISKFNK